MGDGGGSVDFFCRPLAPRKESTRHPHPHPTPFFPAAVRGAAEKIKRENDVHLRQLAKKSTYVLFFFLVRFWAFLGKGSSKTRETKLSTFQKKSPGKYFFGEFFSG